MNYVINYKICIGILMGEIYIYITIDNIRNSEDSGDIMGLFNN